MDISLVRSSPELMHPWVSCNFPFLERLRVNGPNIALNLEGFSSEEAGCDSPHCQLLKLLDQGFYPKNLIKKLHNDDPQKKA